MEDKEAIFLALDNCLSDWKCACCQWEECDVFGHKMVQLPRGLAEAILGLLKPRVLTLKEARNVEVVWVEDRSTATIFPCVDKNGMNDSKLYKYGVQWRCWTSRPTDEQRKAVKWDD